MDGVRIDLPADNRLDFSRFLTADVSEIQIQKGYASVLDGPGAMGGAINLVTRKPAKAFEAEGSIWTGWPRQRRRLEWLCDARHPPAPLLRPGQRELFRSELLESLGRLRTGGQVIAAERPRLSSDTSDSRYNVKAGWTPNDTDEYTINYIKQLGEKGAPLNVDNNPPVPPNSYWRWPGTGTSRTRRSCRRRSWDRRRT